MRASTRRGRPVVSSRLASFVAEILEQRTLFTGSLPAGYRLMETLQLRHNVSSATTSTLNPSTQYYLRVTGVLRGGGADPEWDAEHKIVN